MFTLFFQIFFKDNSHNLLLFLENYAKFARKNKFNTLSFEPTEKILGEEREDLREPPSFM